MAWDTLLKEMCLKIVGSWYNETTDQRLIFSFNDILKMNPLIIIDKDKKPVQTIYGIGQRPLLNPTLQTIDTGYYFDVGEFNKRYFEIISITKNRMELREFYMANIPDEKNTIIYIRKNDTTTADNLLQGLDLE